MPVRLSTVNLDLEEKSLHHFLQDYPDRNWTNQRSPIISYSQTFRSVDLLSLLAQIDLQKTPHFYWENKKQQQRVLAYGSVQSFSTNHPHRFQRSRQFVENCLANICPVGDRSIKFLSQSRLFCSFSFFGGCALDNPYPAATIFLPEFQLVQNQNFCTLTLHISLERLPNFSSLIDQINQQIQKIEVMADSSYTFYYQSQSAPTMSYLFNAQNTDRFAHTLRQSLEAIATHRFSKIVLAHALDLSFPKGLSPVTALHHLRQQYDNCYVFSTSNGQGNCFLGASPERLACLHQGQLIADALAGSISRGQTPAEDRNLANQLLNSEKERREHQAVIDFILQRLRQLELNPYPSPLNLLQLSNIQHLWTPIHATLSYPLHPLTVVEALHPTPAVAGVPTSLVCEEIRRYEPFDRGLYAAPLGWVDGSGNGEFIVGIRSALLQGDRARLYAGAGIVAGSDPQRELAEIQLKFQALFRALA
jgi:menaquinone-specific isochorismate synthase